MLLAFAIPIYQKVVPYIIASILITWLLEADFANKARMIAGEKHRFRTLFFALLYMLYGLGLLYSENFGYGYFDMEVKMSLFIFPVIMSSIKPELLSAEVARKVLWAFVSGVVVTFILCYSFASYQYYNGGDISVFYYSGLTPLMHSSYLAMYICFAIAILLYFIERGLIRGRRNLIGTIILLGLLEIFVVMISSKAGILGLVVVIVLYAVYILVVKKQLLRGMVAGGLFAFSLLIVFQVFPFSAERFQQSRNDLGETSINSDEVAGSTGERVLIWWYLFEITNENYLFGVGTGDVKDNLLAKYEEKEMISARQKELNAHNQYFQTMITLGIIGLIILLLYIILPVMYSLENRHYLYLIFIVLVGFNFLFESMLETQAGVVFYAFFNAYLFAIKKDPAS
jgi:O-antigen ligase